MYLIKRVTTAPATALRVQVAQADGNDAGLAAGGTYFFEPAGQDGDTAQVSEHVARALMEDPGIAVHFSCQPELPKPAAAAEPAPADEPAQAAPKAKRARGGGKGKAKQ